MKKPDKINKYTLQLVWKHKYFYLFFILPTIILLVLFNYRPMSGIVIAFQNFNLANGNFWSSPFVGLENFKAFLGNPRFYQALRNTLGISILSLVIAFPLPIIFALLLNEIHNIKHKRFIQTVTYLPHFISWVVVATMVYKIVDQDSGIINRILSMFAAERIPFMREPDYFWGITIASSIWKELGWNAVIYITAITSIDPQLYEAAVMDGARRLDQIRYITIPCIAQTISLLFILRVGTLVSSGGLFDAVYNLNNPMVNETSYTLEMYAYYEGITFGKFSYATAITLTQAVIGFALVLISNAFYKKVTKRSIF